jgi:FkbM family methyltransferase
MPSLATDIRLGRILMWIRPAPFSAFLKSLLRVGRREFTAREGRFWVDPASYQGLRILRTGEYEPDMANVLKTWLRPGDTFIDLGANEGYFSVLAAKLVGPSGHVVAIEPQARLQAVVARNLELNHIDRVSLVHAAVSDREGTAALHLTPGVNNSASSLMQPTRYSLATEQVPTTTLLSLLDRQNVARARLLKIDVEGWEYEAVLGSRELFRAGRIDALALELHPHLLSARGLDGSEIVRFLESCGYRPQTLGEHTVYVRQPAAARPPGP